MDQTMPRSNAQRQAAYRTRLSQARRALLAAQGLPALPKIPNAAGWPRWKAAIRQVEDLLEQVKDEMQTYYDERSERWLESEPATLFEERMESLQEIIDLVKDWH